MPRSTRYTASNEVWCEVEPAEAANGVTCPSTEPTTPPTAGSLNTVDLGATITYYDAAGNPTYVTDPIGQTTETAYTSAELPWCNVDATEFTTAAKSCPSSAPSGPPVGTVTGYTTTLYNATGSVSSVTNPTGATTTYGYTNATFPNTATEITDYPDGNLTTAGNATTITLDSAGRPTNQTETFGSFSATTLSAYDSAGRLYCAIDPLAYAQGHHSCPSLPLSAPTPGSDPWPGAEITIYNDDGQPAYQVSPLGGVTETAYDGAGNVYCSVPPADYAAGTSCPSTPPTTPPTGTTTGYTTTIYDALGRPQTLTNPLGATTASVYDPAGNATQTTVESNDTTHAPNIVTQFSYDADNQLTSTTVDPGGGTLAATTEQSSDPDGNVFCTVSANAYAQGTGAYQCPTWQSAWIAAPPSPTSLYSNTPTSAQAKDVTTTFFNPDGQQIQSTNPDVETTVSAVNADGNAYCSSDPTNMAAWLSHNPTGTYPYLCPSTPPTSAPTGTTTGYMTTIFDAAGNTLSSTDQVGDTTSYSYDATGNLLTTTDPRGKVTTDCYYYENASGQCANGAPGGGGLESDQYSTTTPATTADPSGELTTTTYFPGDLVETTSNPAATTTDAYDVAGDLTSVTSSGVAAGYGIPANVSYSYNSDGTRHAMTDDTGTTTYGYDDNGDVTSKALVATGGLANATTSYGYFDTGVLSSVTYPTYGSYSTPQVTYAYDATGAMISETDWLGNSVTFAHDADQNPTTQTNAVSVSNPSGTSSTTVSYDAADYPTTSTSTLAQTCGGSESLTQSFSGTGGSRNADGQVTGDSESYSGSCSGQGAYQRNYSYDAAGRVVYQGWSAQGSNPNNIVYDASGDPTTMSNHDNGGNFDTYTQAYDSAGEITSQTPTTGSGGVSTTYSYDTAGDQITAASAPGTTSYGYSSSAQMTSATSPAGSASYLYDGNGLEAATTTIGSLWSSANSIDGTTALNGVSCPSTSSCVGVDNTGHALTYNGSSWSSASDIDGTTPLNAVSCSSTSFCVAVDNTGHALTYNGSSWSLASDIDGTTPLNAVSCPSTSFCLAVDNTGHALTYNGSSWSSASDIDGTGVLKGVSCPSASFCAAVDFSGNALTYTAGSWSSPVNVDPSRMFRSVSCPNASFCVGVDTSGHELTYNGSSWSAARTIDAGGHTITSVSCPTAMSCQAVDKVGNQMSYNGTTWSSAVDIDGSNTFSSVSCAAAGACVALDASGNALTYKAALWSSANSIDGTTPLNGVSCPSTSSCVGVDNTGHALTYNGSSWSSASDIDGTTPLNAVSCSSTSFCVAVDNTGHALTYNGSSWSLASDIDGTTPLNAVSCPSTSFCLAVDNTGHALTYNGSSWSSASDIDGTGVLKGVSCPSASFCAAVDFSGNALTYTAGSWSSPVNVDPSRMFRSVSCPNASFCVGVDTSGHELTYNGSSWSAARTIDAGGHTITSVSCPTAMSCQAVDKVGNQMSYNGTTWSSAVDIDGSNTFSSVSCAAAGACVALDASGNALTYKAPSSLAQVTWNTNSALPLVLSDSANDYIYGPADTPVEQVNLATSTPTYLTYTASNSSWLAINGLGDETGYWRYDAFGNLAFGTPASPFGYAGQYTDTTTNLDNMRARWYEPETGAFTTRDPAFALTDTAYGYSGDDPVNNNDPSGFETVTGGTQQSNCTYPAGSGVRLAAEITPIGQASRLGDAGLSYLLVKWVGHSFVRGRSQDEYLVHFGNAGNGAVTVYDVNYTLDSLDKNGLHIGAETIHPVFPPSDTWNVTVLLHQRGRLTIAANWTGHGVAWGLFFPYPAQTNPGGPLVATAGPIMG